MKFFHDDRQRAHDPQFRLENGRVIQNPDRPERVDLLVDGATRAGLVRHAPTDHGMGALAAIHPPRYLDYLQSIFARRLAAFPDLSEVVPSRFCLDPQRHYSPEAEAQIGFHNADTSCPIGPDSWNAIYWSAQTALSGAYDIVDGAPAAYALSRPSGHHAYQEIAGGFCFLNNSAIAAEYLRVNGHRPVVLDIDVHHGNGTQAIFYDRDDVLTISLHVDPVEFYPFYAGAASEVGTGSGTGYNLNLPLPRGAGIAAYMPALDTALAQIAAFGATAVVVALGLDTHEDDPFRGMSLTTGDFATIGRAIRGLDLPVLNVQEGGYMQTALGDNLASYLGAFTA
ncbi:histone deacetylase family protein [Paracoccus sp. JM45]|uniref:histone deacetylase family protein n=1 Tax=Paracoccus sp. JM45 TaxID=2283626 RepID=UPI000E6C7A1C|nr:histone deacetylase family protein [Paracoccus sp. JM45]RJE79224.1 histone deacetylase family protein [Paracoccus sp. JM45]